MSKYLSLLLAPVLAGCLTTSPVSAVRWTVRPALDRIEKRTGGFGVVRLSQVAVRSPYDAVDMALLRKDGSVAFDSFNRFAATPSALLKGGFYDILRASGLFKDVLPATSAARSDLSAEIDVSRLALESADETLRAVVSLQLTLIDQKERSVKAVVSGSASADASSGLYADAFSEAFTLAVDKALKAL